MNTIFRQLALLGCALAAGGASAAIISIAPGSLMGSELVTFDDVAGGAAPGTNYDAVFVSGGVSFAERFVGQTNTPAGGFDVLSNAALAGLSLQIGTAGQNLNIFLNGSSQVLTGLGPAGFPSFGAIGEGAFAALFTTDQSEFGFDLVGGDGGSATVDFWARDGSLLGSILVGGLSTQSYAFQSTVGNDIAGISIWNNDGAGIGFDNLRFDVPSGTVPVPGTLALVGLGLLAAARAGRRSA
jgi:hypothetical protein